MTRTPRQAHFLLLALLLGVAGLTGCAVGPNYKRPAVDVPGTYRGSTVDPDAVADTKSQEPKSEQARIGSAPSLAMKNGGTFFRTVNSKV